MAESMNDLIREVLGDDSCLNYMGEELRFLYEADNHEYELYYFRDKVNQLEFMHMIKYFLEIDNMFMLIRFVYKHSSYLLKDCLYAVRMGLSESGIRYKIDTIIRNKVMVHRQKLLNA